MSEDNFRIGIVGGAGRMGRLFRLIFERRGYEVLISDLGVGLSLSDLLRVCKVVILSVPMEVFSDVVKEISPYVNDHHWIMDICSLKVEPSKIMRKYIRKGELLATHPLFGPFEETLKGRTIAICPLRGKAFRKWFTDEMKDEGLKIVEISPKRHDEIMGLVQVINHFWLLLLAKLIRDAEVGSEELVNLSTPSFLTQLRALSRLARQDEELYFKIQFANPYGKKFRKLFCKNCSELNNALNGDTDSAEKVFREYFRLARDKAKELGELFAVDMEQEPSSCNHHAKGKQLSHS